MSETDPVTWYLAQLDEEEQLARHAGAPDAGQHWIRPCWHEEDPDEEIPPLSQDTCCTIRGPDLVIYDEGGHDAEQAEFIIHHDPAHVLADIATKRQIIELYRHKQESMAQYPNQGNAGGLFALTQTLRLLMLPYAHRPGYDPAWAPECTVRGTPEPPTS